MSVQPSTHVIDDIQEVLISKEQIEAKVAEMGGIISREYEGRDLLWCASWGPRVYVGPDEVHIHSASMILWQ